MSADAEALTNTVIRSVLSTPLSSRARALLEQFAPAPSQRSIYLSTPITTGPRLLRWLARNREAAESVIASGSGELVREEVVKENVSRLGPLREKLRADYPDCYLIDPTTLEVPGWRQWEYHRFWAEVLIAFADEIVFADGWHLSTGCTVEYIVGLLFDIPMSDSSRTPLVPARATQLLERASSDLEAAGRDPSVAQQAAIMTKELSGPASLKDTVLAQLSTEHNVASFVSFTPYTPRLRYQVLPGVGLRRDASVEVAIENLIAASPSKSVNVRTFTPLTSKGNPFYYGLTTVDQALERVQSSAADGYYTIVNETLDVHDGGVSGVSLGGVLEFSPDRTPRGVEGEGSARFPVELGNRLLKTVYGEFVTVPHHAGQRIEFSVHPRNVGHRQEHVIVWEREDVEAVNLPAPISWPNAFSAMIGDKAFGLMVADLCGAHVPRTTVISRRVAPFLFGRSTQTAEWWLRTAPREQDPGRFTTVKGWTDPFALLAKEDVDGKLASVLAQESVRATYSGATVPTSGDSANLVEGVAGYGDAFMLGESETVDLPGRVQSQVQEVISKLTEVLGPVRIEWAADGRDVWVLQLHARPGDLDAGQISPGEADEWVRFDPKGGLDQLHDLVDHALEVGAGIEVTRPIGVTSHVGDILRKAHVPARFAPEML